MRWWIVAAAEADVVARGGLWPFAAAPSAQAPAAPAARAAPKALALAVKGAATTADAHVAGGRSAAEATLEDASGVSALLGLADAAADLTAAQTHDADSEAKLDAQLQQLEAQRAHLQQDAQKKKREAFLLRSEVRILGKGLGTADLAKVTARLGTDSEAGTMAASATQAAAEQAASAAEQAAAQQAQAQQARAAAQQEAAAKAAAEERAEAEARAEAEVKRAAEAKAAAEAAEAEAQQAAQQAEAKRRAAEAALASSQRAGEAAAAQQAAVSGRQAGQQAASQSQSQVQAQAQQAQAQMPARQARRESSDDDDEDPDSALGDFMKGEEAEDEKDDPDYEASAAALSGAIGWNEKEIESNADAGIKALADGIGGKKVVDSLKGMMAGVSAMGR